MRIRTSNHIKYKINCAEEKKQHLFQQVHYLGSEFTKLWSFRICSQNDVNTMIRTHQLDRCYLPQNGPQLSDERSILRALYKVT